MTATSDLFTLTRPAVSGGAPVVVGLDLSLTNTGYAVAGKTGLIKSTGHKGDSLEQRWSRLCRLRDEIIQTALARWPDLVVIEAPSLGQSRQAGELDRHGLWWLIVDHMHQIGSDVIEVPPGSLKKYITGNGSAGKNSISMHLLKRFGVEIDNDNEADAFGLRALGLDLIGHPLADMPVVNRTALEKLPRPVLGGAA